MTFKVGTLSLPNLAPGVTRIGKDWLAQYQDDVTGWDIRSWSWQPDLPVGQHHKVSPECALSQVGAHPDMTLHIARL